MLLGGLAIGLVPGVLSATPASATTTPPTPSPPFNECPAVGLDSSCGVLIVIPPNGKVTTATDTSQPPYDRTDDTLVGVVNNSTTTIDSLPLAGTDIFAFDGDGLCTQTPRPAGCMPAFGPTGYEGPNTSFNVTNTSTGTVIFTGGLAPEATAYFSLETASVGSSLVVDAPIQAVNVPAFTVTGGTSFTATVGGFTDPDTSAVPGDYKATINWGDGPATSAGTITGSNGTFSVAGTHTYATTSATPYTVTVTITDLDGSGNNAIATTAITSQDPPIAATPVPGPTVEVGHQFTANLATFTDPDPTAVPGDYSATINWGDGSATDTTTPAITEAGGTFTVAGTHTYPGAPGTFTVTVTITDLDGSGNNATVTSSVTAKDQPISVAGEPALTIQKGTAFTGPVATFTDPDTSATGAEYSATINWGDSSTSTGTITGSTGGPFTVSGSHTYTTTTATNIQVTITDIDNPANTGVAITPVTVYDVVQTCAATQTCTATDTSPAGLTSTVTAISSTSGTVNLVIGGTLSCSDSFFHAPAVTTITTSGLTTKLPKIVVLAITKQAAQAAGSLDPSRYAVCYSSTTAFHDYKGHLVTTGILPNCGLFGPGPPCVALKFRTLTGGIDEVVLVPASDPHMR